MKLMTWLAIAGFTVGLGACSGSDKEDEPPAQNTSGTLEFDTSGTFLFTIDADGITADITIIGAGGGGAGGTDHNGNVNNSTGGGGGGGAGEVLILQGIQLDGNTEYRVIVGKGGTGGSPGANGQNGQASVLAKGVVVLYTAEAGYGGQTGTAESMTGGQGGSGFPAGQNGGNGEISSGFTPEASPGAGGIGGKGTTLVGYGGDGGTGAEIKNGNPINPFPGSNGSMGYIKIDWAGIR